MLVLDLLIWFSWHTFYRVKSFFFLIDNGRWIYTIYLWNIISVIWPLQVRWQANIRTSKFSVAFRKIVGSIAAISVRILRLRCWNLVLGNIGVRFAFQKSLDRTIERRQIVCLCSALLKLKWSTSIRSSVRHKNSNHVNWYGFGKPHHLFCL